MPVPELAHGLITVLDGVTTTWLVDRDTPATRTLLEPAAELFALRYAAQQR